jgi:hypothetical protein
MTSTYGNISDNFRGEDGPFGPAVPVADDASDQIRLLAYAGRVT